jgi:hypothetical protein
MAATAKFKTQREALESLPDGYSQCELQLIWEGSDQPIKEIMGLVKVSKGGAMRLWNARKLPRGKGPWFTYWVLKSLALILFCGSLAACAAGGTSPIAATPAAAAPQAPAISDKQAFADARAAVLKTLRDPASAMFAAEFKRKIVVPYLTIRMLLIEADEHTDIVCGTVNAKNGFGGYVGSHVFAYRVGRGDVFLDAAGERLGSIWCVDSKDAS